MMTVLAPGAPWPNFEFMAQPIDANTTQIKQSTKKKHSVADRILEYLKEYPGAYSKAMAADFHYSNDFIVTYLSKMVKGGLIFKTEGEMMGNGGTLMNQYWLKETLQ